MARRAAGGSVPPYRRGDREPDREIRKTQATLPGKASGVTDDRPERRRGREAKEEETDGVRHGVEERRVRDHDPPSEGQGLGVPEPPGLLIEETKLERRELRLRAEP